MSNLPNGTRGKFLALSISVAVLCAFYVAIVLPLLSLHEANAQALQDRHAVLERYEAAVRDLPRLRREAMAWSERSGSDVLLPGSGDAIAAAGLQSTLKDLVETGGAMLESAQVTPAETAGEFRRVGVQLSFSGTLELLASVLLGIETANPVLTVGALEIHALDKLGEELAITIDVHGFRSQ
jgi:hypothetical protein